MKMERVSAPAMAIKNRPSKSIQESTGKSTGFVNAIVRGMKKTHVKLQAAATCAFRRNLLIAIKYPWVALILYVLLLESVLAQVS
jgi:hypothetical protein